MTDSYVVRVYNSKGFSVASTITATGNITAYYSDERLKTKIGKIESPLDKVGKLNGFMYIENDLAREHGYTNTNVQVALSAQEVQSVMPQAVSLAPFDIEFDEYTGETVSKSGENYLTVDYAKLVPLLVESIKELSAKVDELQSKM